MQKKFIGKETSWNKKDGIIHEYTQMNRNYLNSSFEDNWSALNWNSNC